MGTRWQSTLKCGQERGLADMYVQTLTEEAVWPDPPPPVKLEAPRGTRRTALGQAIGHVYSCLTGSVWKTFSVNDVQ
jgi:hypothetical protein